MGRLFIGVVLDIMRINFFLLVCGGGLLGCGLVDIFCDIYIIIDV